MRLAPPLGRTCGARAAAPACRLGLAAGALSGLAAGSRAFAQRRLFAERSAKAEGGRGAAGDVRTVRPAFGCACASALNGSVAPVAVPRASRAGRMPSLSDGVRSAGDAVFLLRGPGGVFPGCCGVGLVSRVDPGATWCVFCAPFLVQWFIGAVLGCGVVLVVAGLLAGAVVSVLLSGLVFLACGLSVSLVCFRCFAAASASVFARLRTA